MNPTPVILSLALLGLTGCALKRSAPNPSGAQASAAEAARLPDPLAERKNRDTVAIERRAADYQRQGRTAEEARALAEVEYTKTAK